MSSITATDNDYKKFQDLLKFFVNQSNKNAKNGRAEKPTMSKVSGFAKCYGLKEDFNKIVGLEFGIHFFNNGWYNTRNSTYINEIKHSLNIVADFDDNQNITNLKIASGSNNQNEIIKKETENCKSYTVEELELDAPAPNEKIKELLDKYMDIHTATVQEKSVLSNSQGKYVDMDGVKAVKSQRQLRATIEKINFSKESLKIEICEVGQDSNKECLLKTQLNNILISLTLAYAFCERKTLEFEFNEQDEIVGVSNARS